MKGNFLSVWVCWMVIILINWLQVSFMQVAQASLPSADYNQRKSDKYEKKRKEKNKNVATIL